MIEELLIYGAISGAVYALLALGFTLIYGVAEILNMAHGALYMLGVYMFVALIKYFELDLFPSIMAAAILVGLIGIAVYGLIRPVIDEALPVLVVTLGATLIIEQLAIIQFGARDIRVPPILSGTFTILGVKILRERFLAFALSLSLLSILWMFITRSKIGLAMRAVAQDREVGMLMGINTERLYILTIFISGSLAAIAGVLLTRPVVNPFVWQYPLTMSFAIVVLGGLGSIKGSLIGAFIVGYAENALIFLVPGGEYLRGAIALAVMVVVLVLRPAGLFGKRVEMER